MMKLKDIKELLQLEVFACHQTMDRDIRGGYVSDILSDVLTHASEGDIWITRQVHLNVIAIAGAKDIAAVIVVKERTPDNATLAKAEEQNIPVLGTAMNAFETAGKLYEMGLR